MISIFAFLLSMAHADKPVKLTHAEAGKIIMATLAQSKGAPRTPQAKAAFELIRRESRAELEKSKAKARKGTLIKDPQRDGVLEMARLEVGADLAALEHHLRESEQLSPVDAFDVMKVLAKKDLLNDTPDPSLNWAQAQGTAARVQNLLLEKLGPAK